MSDTVPPHVIRRAYEQCLGRQPSPKEVQGWVYFQGSDEAVFWNICESEEGKTVTIRAAYLECLGRPASDDEVKSWIPAGARAAIREGICISDEAYRYALIGGGVPNHLRPGRHNDYDVWQANCHTATNTATLESPRTNGAVTCGGNPETNPGYHTYSYVLAPDGATVTYFNWGKKCGPCSGKPPEQFDPTATDCHTRCARDFCQDQFGRGVRSLPPGTLVESPGPSACLRETEKRTFPARPDCETCCDRRADMWAKDNPRYRERGKTSDSFRRACKYLCRRSYP